MKKVFASIMVLAAMAVITGCFTSATAYTKKTSADGVVTESRCSIIGTGDKVSQIAADGLFADGTTDDLGAGVKKANASQQSTGIDGTLNGLGQLMTGMAKFMAASQGVKTTSPVGLSDTVDTETAPEQAASLQPLTEPTYSTDGYGGVPGANGEGVYGRPSCGRCRAYRAAHPDTQIINLDDPANRAAMWAALKKFKFGGERVELPVSVTADSYTLSAK